jgi:hypothetical protein
MRSDELNERQHQERGKVIDVLSAAGWSGPKTNTLFEQGWWMPHEAVLGTATRSC